MTTATVEASATRFEEAFSNLRSVLRTERCRQLSKFVWDNYTDAELHAFDNWFDEVRDRLNS